MLHICKCSANETIMHSTGHVRLLAESVSSHTYPVKYLVIQEHCIVQYRSHK